MKTKKSIAADEDTSPSNSFGIQPQFPLKAIVAPKKGVGRLMADVAKRHQKDMGLHNWSEYVNHDIEVISCMRFGDFIWHLKTGETSLIEVGPICMNCPLPERDSKLRATILVDGNISDSVHLLKCDMSRYSFTSTSRIYLIYIPVMGNPSVTEISAAEALLMAAKYHYLEFEEHHLNRYRRIQETMV